MNKINPTIQALLRSMYIHTYTYVQTDKKADSIPKTTFSYSMGLKTCQSVKISKLIFLTVTILPLKYYIYENVKSNYINN
jgi:hypothetical protein